MRKLLTMICFLPSLLVARNFTISGFVSDAKSRETLVAATLYESYNQQGAVTNEYGFYSLTIPEGAVNISTSYVGYRNETIGFVLTGDTTLNISLGQLAELEEVTIVGNRAELGVKGSQISAIDLPVEQIKAVPTMFGEADVLKALQLLPGVQAGTEGTAGIYVRGGNPDENLLLIDGVPVYNVNHMFGLFSTFNPDAIKNVTLYKGSFPAHYCGRLSSIVDVRMKDGNMNAIHGNFSIGMVSSKFNIEGPLVKDKTTFNFSIRRTYSDLIINSALLLNKYVIRRDWSFDRTSFGYYFYDMNAKVSHKFSDRDRLYLSLYSGDDDIFFKYKMKDGTQRETAKLGWKWGNMVTAVRWNHIISPRLFMDLSANYTQYRHNFRLGVKSLDKVEQEEAESEITMKSGIFDKNIRGDFHYTPNPDNEIRFGGYLTHHTFRPDVMSYKIKETYNDGVKDTTESYNRTIGPKKIGATEIQLYAEDNITLWDVVKANAGLSYSFFNVNGRSYHSLEPRFSGRVLLTDDLSFKAGYAYMTQYVHLLSNSMINLPTDLWVPVTENILPEKSHQVAAGIFYNLKGVADLSVEGYYKLEDNLLEYKEGTNYMAGDMDWQKKVAMGKGWSYGVEFMAQRSVGRVNGWVSYTWSHTQRLFDRPGMVLNGGNPFNAKYDRRHEFNITGNYSFNDHFDLSATWIYATGNCGTIYTQYYEAECADGYSTTVGYFEDRNNFRLAPYHRLDLGLNWHKPIRNGWLGTFSLSIYNAYNNQNPFLVYVYTDYDYSGEDGMPQEYNELKQISLFPILPSFSYTVTF